MKSATHWPKNLYLIASGNTPPHHKPNRENMGSKAFNLLRMANIGLPVPPALVIGTHYTKAPDECMLPVFVGGLPAGVFEDEIERATEGRDERLLDFRELRDLTHQFLSIYQLHAGQAFPQDVNQQLSGAIRAVFASWHA